MVVGWLVGCSAISWRDEQTTFTFNNRMSAVTSNERGYDDGLIMVCLFVCFSLRIIIVQLADTVSLHFLSLMETLMECNSEILARVSAVMCDASAVTRFRFDCSQLIPLWLPLFNSYQGEW